MASKDDIIADLRKLVDEQSKRIDALLKEIDQLKLQLAKANKDSSNSSKSPSSDIIDADKGKKKNKPGRPRKRKIGGQPGRERKLREPLPPERIDETIEYEIEPDESGKRYHERMWTAIATCKKQNKNFFDFLHASIQAKLNGTPAPSLIG